MKTLDQITRALGEPQASRTIHSGSHTVAAIARWRHGGACIDLNGSDAYQVIFNLSGGQIVELQAREQLVSRREIRAGSISLNAPQEPTQVNVLGYADTLHILMTPEWIETVSGGADRTSLPELTACAPQLQAAAAQALVALERPPRKSLPELDAIVRTMANRFADPVTLPKETSTGGLSPAARRRVWALIEKRIHDCAKPPPKLQELADVAGLSLHHFIKAFRRTEGDTPHARLLGFRLEHALDLMLGRNARVDQASDETGFSSPSHFVSVFRKHLGVTPGALRDAALLRH
jgi:AraC family transcriptional regulator